MAKKQQTKVLSHQYHCGECKHHYDEHEKNVHGEFFMARCPFREWAVFMNHDWCERFELMK